MKENSERQLETGGNCRGYGDQWSYTIMEGNSDRQLETGGR